jgi:AraC family transcriptional regulator
MELPRGTDSTAACQERRAIDAGYFPPHARSSDRPHEMDPTALTESIGRRFHRPPAPSVVACASTRRPILFSHIASDRAMPGRTLPPPIEEAYAFHVHHTRITDGEMWLEGRHLKLPLIDHGGVFIFDLRTAPIAQLHHAFEFSRFQLSRAAIEELAYEQGARRVGELHARHGVTDPVVRHLALAMTRRIELFGKETDSLFTDGIALAFFTHAIQVYGSAITAPVSRGSLASWQVRRISEWVDANLDAAMSIADIAGLVDLSSSHFSRAFAVATGLPPHRWLMQRRIQRAKSLLRATSMPLSEIAALCGFVDQSHFTRVFARLERQTPARWRQALR